MPYSPPIVRKPLLVRSAPRPGPPPTALRPGRPARHWTTARPAQARPTTLLVRAARALHELVALVRDRDPTPKAEPGASLADFVEAKLMSDQWRQRAEAAEARAGELEALLAAAEMAALELRSRIVCLQGKLATASATARYQTLSLALEHSRPTPLDSAVGPG